ncbi:phage tail spike protein [Aerococcus viridans]
MAIIYLYDSTVTDFTYNGQPLNKAYEVVVDNMINDSFFVTFNHPLDDKGKYKTIEKDKIVKVHTPDGMQPFRIMDRVKYMDHISVEAWPLFYADMRNKLVKPLTIRGLSGQAAVNTFVNNLLISTPFTFTSNITDAHDYHTQDTEERENNPNQLYNALDVFKDIVTRWKGELVINGYDIRLLGRLGKNTGALLYEKKNISDFTDEESIQDITTRLYGKSEWTERPEGSDEEIKHEISVKVESPLINAYSGIVFEKQYTNNDIRTEKEMKDWLNLKFTTDNIDKPSRSIQVGTNIVDDTVINMGDSLILKYVKHDVDMEIRMVGYTYDGYANRYITVQLGDARQSYVGNVQNTVRELETNVNTNVKQTVNQILNANGERMIYSVTEPVGNFKNGDVWYDQQGGMYFWDEEKGMWIDHPYNRNMNVVAGKVDDAAKIADEAVQSAQDADVRANEAIEKAGANANLLATHQSTLDTIKNTTIPSINSVISDAMGTAQSALSSANSAMSEAKTALSSAGSAMDEAKKADGKIANYVTKNGLVNGTTVDSKINTATGAISKKITTVEGKIPTEIGGRNLIKDSGKEVFISSLSTGHNDSDLTIPLVEGETYTLSFDAKAKEPLSFRKGLFINSGTNGVGIKPKMAIDKNYSRYTSTFVFKDILNNGNSFKLHLYPSQNGKLYIKNIKLEKGNIATDWTPAPEDNYTQEEFKIFESTYDEDVKGINSTLTELSNKKVDGTTYQDFYNNEYKKTAKGVTDTYAKVNKIIDANGNAIDTFAKAVYEKNATRQSASFNEVTKNLVKTATYTAGINGINSSISTIRGDLDNLSVGGRNLVKGTSDEFKSVVFSDWNYYVEKNIPVKGGTYYTLSARVIKEYQSQGLFIFEYNDEGVLTENYQINLWYRPEHSDIKNSLTIKTKPDTVGVHLGFRNNQNGTNRFKYREFQLEQGNIPTDWSPAPEDMLGKSDFTVFKNDYKDTAESVERRLTAIDSSEEGSVVTRLNATEKTASGNTTTISNIKTKPGEQITGYQTIKERSDLYERVIGNDENGVKGNISRIVQASGIIQSEVASAVPNPNLLSGTDFKEGLGDVIAYGREPTLSEASFFPYGKVATIQTPETSGTANVGFAVKIPKKDTWYTLSFYGLANWVGSKGVGFYSEYMKSSKNYKAPTLNGSPSRHRIQITVQVTLDNAWLFVSPQGNTFGAYANIVFYGVKLEVGEVATPWENSDPASSSKITQLADNINLKVSKGDLLSQINVQAGGVLITSGTNKLNVTPTTTYIENGTIKSAMIESITADKITTGTLDAGKVKVVNLDANNITANITDFIKTNWNEATGGGVTITGSGVRAINSEGSRVTLENGVVSVGNRAGVNLGFFGDHILNKESTGTMTITASHGTETAFISATSTDGKTYKRSMSIMAGAGEIDMFTTLDMNKNALKDVTNIGFTGGHIKGTISDNGARYMTIDAGTGTSFDVSGTTRMSITSVVNIFSGIDMKGKDIASVGKLTYNSDQRLKTNIKDTNIRALDAIRNWQLVSYDWLESGEHVEIGLIAQNSPEVMTYNLESDIYGIDAGKQTMINTLAIQQLDSKTNDEVAQLKAQIASLQDELALLKGA